MQVSTRMSALLSVVWDWAITGSTSAKQTRTQEAFKYNTARLNRSGGDELAYPFDVVDTRLTIPGHGRAMKVRYESTSGKDFVLIGHSIEGVERTESETRG